MANRTRPRTGTDKRAIFTASRLAQEAADHLSGVPGMGEAVESPQDAAGSPRAAA